MPVTILEIAKARGVEEDVDGGINMGSFHAVGLDMLGGCCICEASLAAYNGYPSRQGYWKCADDIADQGFETVEAFEQWLMEEDENG